MLPRFAGTRILRPQAILLASVLALCFFNVMPSQAKAAVTIGLQLANTLFGSGCSDLGTPAYSSDGTGWAYIYDPRGGGTNCGRPYIAGTPTYATDYRFCVYVYADGSWGSVTCTPWTSQGGGWTPFNGAVNNTDIDAIGILIDTQPLLGRQISALSFAIQFADAYFSPGCNPSTDSGLVSATNSGWGNFVGDSDDWDPNCMRIYLGPGPINSYVNLVPSVADRTSYVAGTAADISHYVYNFGSANSGAFYDMQFYDNRDIHPGWDGNGVNGDFWRGTYIPNVPPGTYSYVPDTYTFNASQVGNWGVITRADYYNTIGETNEADNDVPTPTGTWDIFTVTAPSAPDLTTINLARSGALEPGQTITFTGNVKNNGTSAAGASNARFCIDNTTCTGGPTTGRLGTDQAVAGLAAGATSAQLSASWSATLGSHTLTLCSDVANAVTTESNESNNCSTLSFTVSGQTSCTLDGVTVPDGGSYTFYNTVSVPYGQVCNTPGTYSQTRTCTCSGGVCTLSGSSSYSHAICSVEAPPAQSNISLSLSSSLVRKGSIINLTWDGGNSTSCSLKANGTQISSALTGTNVAYTVNEKTVFMLTCDYAPLSTSKTTSATVNLIPMTQEI